MSSEYGWSDEQIGDLPLVRLRQVTSSIQLRKFREAREENSRFSWLARHVTGYIAMGFEVAKGKPNVPLENAAKLAYDDIERALLGVEVKKAETAPAENKPGSFESFMRFSQQGNNKG